MCEQKIEGQAKVDRLIAALDRLSEKLDLLHSAQGCDSPAAHPPRVADDMARDRRIDERVANAKRMNVEKGDNFLPTDRAFWANIDDCFGNYILDSLALPCNISLLTYGQCARIDGTNDAGNGPGREMRERPDGHYRRCSSNCCESL